MGISINLTGDDAAAANKPNAFEDLPKGWFEGTITGCELREVKATKEVNGEEIDNPNAGKPMYNIELTVSEDDPSWGGRKDWSTACLWYEARFTIINILKALGQEIKEGELDIPDEDFFIGQPIAWRRGASKKDPRIQCRGFRPAGEGDKAKNGSGVKPAGAGRQLI